MRISIIVLTLMMFACAKEPQRQTVACADPVAGCRLDNALSIRFSKTPTIMEKFGLDVQASQDAELHASFQMQGMDMGPNRYRLIWNGSLWHADVMLPACIRGRRDWVLQLEVGKKIYEMPFTSGS